MPVTKGRTRCLRHGSKSTGPKVNKYRANIYTARDLWLERYHRAGLRAPMGFAVTPMAVIRKYPEPTVREMSQLIEAVLTDLPAKKKALDDMTLGELLADNTRLSLLRLREIVAKPLPKDADLKERRLVIDAASTQLRVMANVQIAALQAGGASVSDKLAKAIEDFQSRQHPREAPPDPSRPIK